MTDKFLASNNNIAIYPKNKESMDGIFAYFKEKEGGYLSNYSILGNVAYGSVDYLCKYYETDTYFATSIDEKTEFEVVFDNSFIVMNYSISNARNSHSYPRGWNLYGKDERGREHLIDKRREIDFCDKELCENSSVKTFTVRKPNKYKSYVIRQIGLNSSKNLFFIIRALEFFGIYCAKESTCFYPVFEPTCKVNQLQRNSLSLVSSLIMILLIES